MKNLVGAIDHLKIHQTFPASRDDLVKECMNLSDFSEEDKKEFMDDLPEGTYNSADEVIEALGWQKGRMGEEEGMHANM